MSKRENDANNVFRPIGQPADRTREGANRAAQKFGRLRAERLAREAEQKDSRKS
jgi:hypothetical protein